MVKLQPPGRDVQRSKTYRWEDDFFACTNNGTAQKEDACLRLIGCIFLTYCMRQPTVTFREKGKFSWAVNWHEIYLTGDFGRRPYVVVHECAHLVTNWLIHSKKFDDEPAHGKVFITVFSLMLSQFLREDLVMLLHSANDYKLKYEDSATVQYELKCLELRRRK